VIVRKQIIISRLQKAKQ